jgi:alcohol dehydrogenase
MHLPSNFEFECPVKTHCGDRALDHIPFEMRAMDVTKPLLIGDEPATREKRLSAVLSACRDAEMTLGVVEDIPHTNPEDTVRQLAAIYRDKDCDAVIAVGQGPCIDVAKWLNLVVSTGQEALAPFVEGQTIPRSIKPLAVIPSAHADGNELSGYLRIGDVTIKSVNLMPQLLFLDPRAIGQPGDVTMAETALIALANGVESFLNENANPMTAIYARTAARQASEALHQLAGRGDRDDRLGLLVAHAAALGGCAVGCGDLSHTYHLGGAIAQTGKISVAQAMGIVLSYTLEQRAMNGVIETDPLLSLLGDGDRYARTPESQRGPSALYLLRNLLNQLFDITDGQVRRTLQDSSLTRQELREAAERAAAKEGGGDPTANETILIHAWEGRPFDN